MTELMLIKAMIRSVLACLLIAVTIVRAADYPLPAEGDYSIRNFKFTSGERRRRMRKEKPPTRF